MRTEFGFIDHIKNTHGLERVGDDCAVLPRDAATDLIVTADMLVEDVDFRLSWAAADDIGHKALAVSLSDIAAMGGRPLWAMVSIAIPEKLWDRGFAETFYEGYAALARRYDVEMVGGDISRSPDRFVVDSIVAGEVAKGGAVLRSGARPGDRIYVTGPLGGAARGLQLLDLGVTPDTASHAERNLIARQLSPEPRIDDGMRLASLPASAMIDLSDGLASDLAHICRSSGVGALISSEALPLAEGLDPGHALEQALYGGEDFELLFTCSPALAPDSLNDRWKCIGEVTASVNIIELEGCGTRVLLADEAFRHF